MATGSNPSALVASSEQLARTAAGVLAESFSTSLGVAQGTTATQSAFGFLLGLAANTTVAGIVLRLSQAAAGTLPTTARFGIADSTGKILALSGNLNALAQWAAGPMQYALTAPYTVTTSGGYYACWVVNGTWSVTQPLLLESGTIVGNTPGAIGASAPPSFLWTGQTDLPAVGASVTLTSAASRPGYYVAFY